MTLPLAPGILFVFFLPWCGLGSRLLERSQFLSLSSTSLLVLQSCLREKWIRELKRDLSEALEPGFSAFLDVMVQHRALKHPGSDAHSCSSEAPEPGPAWGNFLPFVLQRPVMCQS